MPDKGLSIKKQELSAKLKTVKLLSFFISFAVICLCFLGLGVENKAHAATYYVDSSITDTNPASATPDCTNYNTGTFTCSGGAGSAYATIADVNVKSFPPDDQVLFRKGQTWREQLTVPSSGTNGHTITFGAFGSGANPQILGSVSKNNAGDWTNEAATNYWYVSGITTNANIVGRDGSRMIKKTNKIDMTQVGDWWMDDPNDRVYVYDTQNPTTGGVTFEIGQRDNVSMARIK